MTEQEKDLREGEDAARSKNNDQDNQAQGDARDQDNPPVIEGELLDIPTLKDALAPPDVARFMNIKPYIIMGVVAALLLFGSMTVWSIAAPLARGTVAPGTLQVESNRKTIQHYEGGIIRELLVQDGDSVEAGDPMVVLESSRANANFEILSKRLLTARARLARVLAQQNDADDVVFPDDILEAAKDNPEIADIMAAEAQSFENEEETLTNRRSIYTEQLAQLDEQIAGFAAENVSYAEQRRLIEEEIEDVQFLFDKGLVERPRLRALQRSAASLTGEIEANKALIAQAKLRKAEIELQIGDLENAQRSKATEELREVQETISGLEEELIAARDVVERLVLNAPQDARVMGLRFHTVGGVVRPGEPILDLVPDNDRLIVNAQVSPLAIDSVHPGLEAEVVLSAFNRRKVPHLKGAVKSVSADRITDERTGIGYYGATIEIPPSELEKIGELELYPGMPADVIIVTGERTFVNYLAGPLIESARRGFINE